MKHVETEIIIEGESELTETVVESVSIITVAARMPPYWD